MEFLGRCIVHMNNIPTSQSPFAQKVGGCSFACLRAVPFLKLAENRTIRASPGNVPWPDLDYQ